LFRYLARRSRRLKSMLIMTYREIELDEARYLNDVLLDLNRERLATRIKLFRFSREQTAALLQMMFAESISAELLEGIYRETEGNPFFVEEVCKALIEEGILYRENGHWRRVVAAPLHIPQSVRMTIQARIGKLPLRAQEVLRVAAVIGREFDFATLAHASGLPDDELIDALEHAQHAQLINEVQRARAESFVFAHALIPSTVRESMGGLRRHRLHRQVAAAIEALRPTDFESLAYHYSQVGDEERAMTYYIQAARRASDLYANKDAIRFYSEALALLAEDDPARFGLLAARVNIFDLTAQRAEQYADAQAMLALAERLDDDERRCAALLALTDYYAGTDMLKAAEPAQRAVAIARDLNNERLEGLALRRLGFAERVSGDFQASKRTLERATDLFLASGDLAEAAACLHAISLTLDDLNDDAEALHAAEEAVQLSRQAGDRRQEAIGLRRLGIIHMNQWDYQGALGFVEQALAMHQAQGDRLEECHAVNVLARIYALSGDFERAEHYSRQTVEMAEELDSGLAKWNAIGNWIFFLQAQGNYERALSELESHQRIAEQQGDPWGLAACLSTRANMLADLGDYGQALEAALALQPIVQSHFRTVAELDYVALLGRCQAELGQYEAARATLETALQEAGQRGLPDSAVQPFYELANLALIEWENGVSHDQALAAGFDYIQQAIARLRVVQSEVGLAYTLNYATNIQLALGHPAEALALAEEALEHCRRVVGVPIWWHRFYYSHARALAASERSSEAELALAQAYAAMMRVADALSDERLRHCWLENVRVNRQIQKAWSAEPA
jgi:tetratricopeptide (TPR) repeat protein